MRRPRAAGSGLAWLHCAAGMLLLTLACGARAADAESIDRGTLDEKAGPNIEQAAGFVVDRTITHFGAEFVRFFSEVWRDQGGTEGIDVTIVERPSARLGSVVWVEHNSQPVVRVFLYAGRSAFIKPSATEAARYVARQLSDRALAGLLMKDPDLGKAEF